MTGNALKYSAAISAKETHHITSGLSTSSKCVFWIKENRWLLTCN